MQPKLGNEVLNAYLSLQWSLIFAIDEDIMLKGTI